MLAAQQAQQASLLTGQEDAYDGLILDPSSLPATPAEFAELLPPAVQVSAGAAPVYTLPDGCWDQGLTNC